MLPESYTGFSLPRTTQGEVQNHTSPVLSSQGRLFCPLTGQLISSKLHGLLPRLCEMKAATCPSTVTLPFTLGHSKH